MYTAFLKLLQFQKFPHFLFYVVPEYQQMTVTVKELLLINNSRTCGNPTVS